MERHWKAMMETRRNFELTLSEGMELLLQAETDERVERRYDRLTRNAGFRYAASIEELNMEASRGIDRSLITSLATISLDQQQRLDLMEIIKDRHGRSSTIIAS